MGLFNRFFAKVRGTSTASSLDWSEIEAELLGADLGPALVTKLITSARQLPGDQAEASVKAILSEQFSVKSRELSSLAGLKVIMVVGVNGTGKTTSVAKLANILHRSGDSVLLAAADTFRAAAVAQLQTWGSASVSKQSLVKREQSLPLSPLIAHIELSQRRLII